MTLAQAVCSSMAYCPAGLCTRWAEPGAGNEGGDEPGPGSAWGQQMMQLERRLQQRCRIPLRDKAGGGLASPHKVSIQEMSYLECRAETYPRGRSRAGPPKPNLRLGPWAEGVGEGPR